MTPALFKHSSFTGHIGVAREDITPPVGIFCRNWGAAKHDRAEGIHRPLTLTALTLQTDPQGKPMVLVDADLGWWRSIETERAFRTRALKALGLEESRFIFGLSHTHSAPPLAEPDPKWQGGELLPAYLKKVEQATIDATKKALRTTSEAMLEWNYGRCNLASNRDLSEPEKTRLVCGYNPAKVADDTLLVGRVADVSGRTIATITNYACHPTTLAWDNKLISPDYIGAMRETIEANTDGVPAIFLKGASGDLAPRYQYVGDPAVADGHGRQLGFASLASLAGMEPPGMELAFDGVVESGAPLAVWKRCPRRSSSVLKAVNATVDLPLKDWPNADELERQRVACTDRAFEERLRRKRDIRRVLGDGKTFSMPFWVWRIGDAFIIGCMVESYSWMQQHLRQRFPDHAIIYMDHINGCIGYLPPAELYDAEVYQVWQTPFDRGSLETLANAYEQAIVKLG